MKKERIVYNDLLSFINSQAENRDEALKIYGIEIKNKIVLDTCLYSSEIPLNFEDCIFVDRFTFYENNLEIDFSFKHCYFLKGLHIIDIRKSKRILLTDCKVKGNFIISGNIDHIATYSTYIESLILSKSIVNKIEIGGKHQSSIKAISILDDNSIGKIQIANSKIEKINFSYLADDTELFNCNINSIGFHKVRNSGNLKLLNCKALFLKHKASHFISTESNLGKAEFFQFDFSSFNEVNILNSVLNDCLFVNTTWANNIKSFSGDQMDNYLKDRIAYNKPLRIIASKFSKLPTKVFYKETKQQLKDKREVYKQIKYALSKQGDLVNEQMFHAMEMDTYNRILENRPKNFSTKFILCLSHISSNYGQSLLRPILFLLIVNGIFFSLLNFTNNLRFIPLSNITFENSIDIMSKFIWYLNPFHKSDELSGIPLIIDVFIRIVSSYSIYNIIRATRRFIK